MTQSEEMGQPVVSRKAHNLIKRMVDAHRSLTRNLEAEVVAELRDRYCTAFWLDEEFSNPTNPGCITENSNSDAWAGSSIVSSNAHPTMPWGLILAWTSVGLSLTLILAITLLGGLDLG